MIKNLHVLNFNMHKIFTNLKKIIKKLLFLSFFYFRNGSMRIVRDVTDKKWRGLSMLIISLVILVYNGQSTAILWLLFLMFLVYQWENRIIAFLALMLLVGCPVLIFFNNSVLAETMALYAYYFLVMTVVLQIVEYNIEQKHERKLKKIWLK